MKIKKVAIGNEIEAYIESRFDKGVNIISSDDNNKGKTIVIQSLMYALGNDPIFPSSFDYRGYYHIIEFELQNGKQISICRKNDSFIIRDDVSMIIFDNLSEFKYYASKKLFRIPEIIKSGMKKVVDPLLFYQLFFVGQDSKDSSNIILKGYYNKEDFYNMLYDYSGISVGFRPVDENEVKSKLKKLEIEKKKYLKCTRYSK